MSLYLNNTKNPTLFVAIFVTRIKKSSFMRLVIIFFLGSLLISSFAFSQASTTSQTLSKPGTSATERPEAEMYKEKADGYLSKANYNEAMAYYKQSLKYAKADGMLAFYLKYNISDCFIKTGESDDKIILSLLEIINYQVNSDFDKEVVDRYKSIAHINLANIYRRQGNSTKSCEILQSALDKGLECKIEFNKHCGN